MEQKKSQELFKFNLWSKLLSGSISFQSVPVPPAHKFCHSRVYFRTWENQTQGVCEWWSPTFIYNRPCSDTMSFQHCSTWGERRVGPSSESSPQALQNTVCYERGEQLGSQSTTAHFESLKERFSPEDHPKSMCFSWKMPLKLFHSLSECLKHCMLDNWTTKPFLVTNQFQITSVLNSGL